MMKIINRVLSDIDGTLIEFNTFQVSPSVRMTLKKLREKGLDIHLVTSRTAAITQELINDLDLGHQLMVTDSGATVFYADTEEIVWKKWLDKNLAFQLSSALAPYVRILCCTIRHSPFNQAEALSKIAEGVGTFEDVPSIFIVHGTEVLQDVEAVLSRFETISCHTEPYGNGLLLGTQIVTKGVNKQLGVQQLMKHIDGNSGQILAIGDSANDISLFEAADIKVAMDNSPDELKLLADFVTGDVRHDGFVVAMEEYKLI